MTACDYCSDCTHLQDVGGSEEICGCSYHIPVLVCELECENASDPDCPFHDAYLKQVDGLEGDDADE